MVKRGRPGINDFQPPALLIAFPFEFGVVLRPVYSVSSKLPSKIFRAYVKVTRSKKSEK